MKRQYVALLALLLLLATGVAIQAQTSASYRLQWNVMVGGGAQSGSASYVLDGTVGESLVGPPAAGSADYQLIMGYTTGGFTIDDLVGLTDQLYLPLVVKPGT